MNLRIKQFGILKDVEIPLEGVVQIAGPHGSGRTSIERAYNYLVTGHGGPGYVSLGDVVRRTEEGYYNPTKHRLGPPGWLRVRNYEELAGWCYDNFWDAWVDRVLVAAGDSLARDILNDHLDVDGEYVTLGGRLELEISNLKGKIERLSARIKATPLPPTDEQIEAQRSRVEGAENAVETGIAANALAALEAAKEGSALLDTLRADRSRLRQRVVASEKLLKAIDTVPGPDHECKTLWKAIGDDFMELTDLFPTKTPGGSIEICKAARDSDEIHLARPLSTLSSTEMWLWDTIVKAHCLAALQSPYLFVDMPSPHPEIHSLVASFSGAFKGIVVMYPWRERTSGDYEYWLESGRLSTSQDVTAHV
jgi:hypothetical protein